MLSRLFSRPVLARLVPGGIIVAAAVADAPGCSGLAAYSRAMNGALDRFASTTAAYHFVDPASFSDAEWTAYAKDIDSLLVNLKAVHPPTWAIAWHQSEIDGVALGEQLAKSAANSGLVTAALVLGPESNAIDTRVASGAVASSSKCGDFASFVADWSARYQSRAAS